jgi:hypothetical protein
VLTDHERKPRPDEGDDAYALIFSDNMGYRNLSDPRAFIRDALKSGRVRRTRPTTFDGRRVERFYDRLARMEWYFRPGNGPGVATVVPSIQGRRIVARFSDLRRLAGRAGRAALRMSAHPGAHRTTAHISACPSRR